MTALLDLLIKEKDVIKRIESLESSRQREHEAIEWFKSNAPDNDVVLPLLISECLIKIQELDKQIRANQLILEAIRNEIRMYFEDLKEESE